MKCSMCSPAMRNVGLLIARLVVAAIFIYAGWGKLAAIDNAAGAFASFGYPAPTFFAYLVGIVELLGGVMVLLGLWVRVAATVLAAVMVVAILTVHLKGGFMGMQLPLALLAANMALVAAGGGDWKVMKGDCVH